MRYKSFETHVLTIQKHYRGLAPYYNAASKRGDPENDTDGRRGCCDVLVRRYIRSGGILLARPSCSGSIIYGTARGTVPEAGADGRERPGVEVCFVWASTNTKSVGARGESDDRER